jgi:hypothetical protein
MITICIGNEEFRMITFDEIKEMNEIRDEFKCDDTLIKENNNDKNNESM